MELNSLEDLRDQLTSIVGELKSIREWKNRQEEEKAARLSEMRNLIIDVFQKKGANFDEVVSVLGILEHEYKERFITLSRPK